jgi:predicted Zn-dependent protease
MRYLPLRLFRAALAVVSTLAGLTCATNPVTGNKEFSLVSESQEIAMGQQGAADVAQTMGLYPDSSVQAYVSRLGLALAAKSERPQLPWSYQVVDDPVVNAFALPGGPIFVSRGILTHMNSEAELVSVLGHETGHITARHSASQISKAEVAQVGLGVGMILAPDLQQFAGLASGGLGILFLKFSRDDETQADDLGFRYAYQAGYDVREMLHVFQTLQRVSGGSRGIPEWQSTHPDPGNRIQKTQARIDSLNKDLSGLTINRAGYLQAVNGMVFGENPRNGYFQGQTFLHPDLKFQLEFPQGWKTQNLTDAVVGASAAGDAVISLRLAGKGPPEQASRKFLSLEGVQEGRTTTVEVHGLSAVRSTFTAQTGQGAIGGVVLFLAYQGKTYRLLGYTVSAKVSEYGPAFRQFTGSFQRVTDPAVLGVQPARIKLVTTDRDLTLQQFNARYPSSIPAAQVALINEIGEGEVFQGHQTYKQVVGGLPTSP